jgi:hypothetical protein
MRGVKIIGAALMAVVALAAVASVTASAALPEFLPASGSFTSKSGSGTLAFKGGNTIECSADTNKGEVTGEKTARVTITFTGCKLFGIVGANSLGDSSGTILTTANGTLCYLNKTAKTVGLQLSPTGKVHIEAGGSLAIVEGTVIGELKPVGGGAKKGPFELVLKQKAAGEQEITKCEGGATQNLSGAEGEGTNKEASEVTTDSINFTNNSELMA